MRRRLVVFGSLLGLLVFGTGLASNLELDPKMVERGRYVAQIGACNDCHTPGFFGNDGTTPVELWLTGDSFGWRGPWGTTYGPNLRIYMKDKTEEQWVKEAKTLRRRPPMPWFNLNAMHEEDLRALYQFVKSFAELGDPAPAYLPPDKEPPLPYATISVPVQEKK